MKEDAATDWPTINLFLKRFVRACVMVTLTSRYHTSRKCRGPSIYLWRFVYQAGVKYLTAPGDRSSWILSTVYKIHNQVGCRTITFCHFVLCLHATRRPEKWTHHFFKIQDFDFHISSTHDKQTMSAVPLTLASIDPARPCSDGNGWIESQQEQNWQLTQPALDDQHNKDEIKLG